MAEAKAVFNDGAAYERLMGRWSRAAGAEFLEWVAPPTGAQWLDVGCGTGAFTELVSGSCSPASLIGVDPFAEQIEYARSLPIARLAEFKVADALNLPFPDRSFDVVASALVINFLPDRPRGIAEMRRVAKPGGLVAGYVWDFAGGRSTGGPLIRGLRAIGIEPPTIPGTSDSSIEALQTVFKGAGLQEVEAREIKIEPTYRDFDDFWTSQTSAITPIGKFIGALSEPEQLRLRHSVTSTLRSNADGSITYSACANAIKARASG
jgi:ubiquinone/menaquinone biosynthesis C-methylase UbiE